MIINLIESVKHKFDKNQRLFWQSCQSSFNSIEKRMLSEQSSVIFQNELKITLIHSLDFDTKLILIIDKYEIYVYCAGIGTSMLMLFDIKYKDNYYLKVNEYLISCLKAKYKKRIYFDKTGKGIKAELIWEKNVYPKEVHKVFSINDLFNWKKSYEVREYSYSNFI
ncbi:MAG: hypothetical protein ACOCWM_04205 [Cyclobacteriaceae bacterium]